MKPKNTQTGVVVACKPVREDMNYAVSVRMDKTTKIIEVRMPQSQRVGIAVRISGQHM